MTESSRAMRNGVEREIPDELLRMQEPAEQRRIAQAAGGRRPRDRAERPHRPPKAVRA